jgi:hypothetical protein
MTVVGKIDPTITRKPGDIVCYTLLPNDLPSLRSPNGAESLGGKVGAHTHHAGVQMMKYFQHPDVQAYISDGNQNGADFFNTCITLDCTSKQLTTAIEMAKALDYVADIVTDPSYPWFVEAEDARLLDNRATVIWDVRQGSKVLVLREQVTCGWLIGDKANDPVFAAIVGKFNLAK